MSIKEHIIENSNNYFTQSLRNTSNLLMIQDCNAQNKLLMNEWSFQGLPLVQQIAHPSSDTNSSRPKTLHPIDLDTVPPYREDLGESAHPVFRCSLHISQRSNPDENEESAFSLTCVHQIFGSSQFTLQSSSGTQSFYSCKESLQ